MKKQRVLGRSPRATLLASAIANDAKSQLVCPRSTPLLLAPAAAFSNRGVAIKNLPPWQANPLPTIK
jgi:hypothetical protein